MKDETRVKLEKLPALPEMGTPEAPVRYSGLYAGGDALELREAATEYEGARKKPGEYTVADYYALPEERRAELIDGVFYDMAAPSSAHQAILLALGALFRAHVLKNRGDCKVFIAPCDVQLDMDDKTMVQPDLLVICERQKIRMRVMWGAPDFVLEILSPSSRRHDMFRKGNKYAEAGVREYWIVDPDRRKVIVYDFAGDGFPAIYGFDAKIPVGIWNGELEMDFAEISQEIAYLYEEEAEAQKSI